MRPEAGQIEVVIVFPVALLLVLLSIQGALWFLGRSVAMDAAQEGARAAAMVGGTSAGGQRVAARALAQLAGPLLSGASVSAARGPDRSEVTVRAAAESIVPGLALTVTARAADPVERFRP
jgi:Flp pilus assembly protein TadG